MSPITDKIFQNSDSHNVAVASLTAIDLAASGVLKKNTSDILRNVFTGGRKTLGFGLQMWTGIADFASKIAIGAEFISVRPFQKTPTSYHGSEYLSFRYFTQHEHVQWTSQQNPFCMDYLLSPPRKGRGRPPKYGTALTTLHLPVQHI